MVDERSEFAKDFHFFSDILFNEETKYPLHQNLNNFSTHSNIPFATPDSTMAPTTQTFNCLPLLLNPISEQPQETKLGKLNIPAPTSTTNDVGGNWFSTPPSGLFSFQQKQRPLPIFNSTAWNTAVLPTINCVSRSKLDTVDNLIRILFHYRNVAEEGGANYSEVFCQVMRYMEEFFNVHDGHQDKITIVNRQGMMQTLQTQTAAQLLPVKQEINFKFIDRVAISFELWCHAAVVFNEENMNDAGRVLLRGIFTKDELHEHTIGVRVDRKTGIVGKALNPIKLGVIFKILAWMKLMGTGGDSWGDYNPDNPLNPSLKPKEQKPLREFFSQQLNQAKQKAKPNIHFKAENKGVRGAKRKSRSKRK